MMIIKIICSFKTEKIIYRILLTIFFISSQYLKAYVIFVLE